MPQKQTFITKKAIRAVANRSLSGTFDREDLGVSKKMFDRLIEVGLVKKAPRIGCRWTTDKDWCAHHNIRKLAGME